MNGRFEKGQTGNAGGRPKKTEAQIVFERKCREWSEMFALDKLKKAADSEKPMEIIAAVKEICDRGFGRAEAVTYLNADINTPAGKSPDESAREIEELLRLGKTGTASGLGHDSMDKGK